MFGGNGALWTPEITSNAYTFHICIFRTKELLRGSESRLHTKLRPLERFLIILLFNVPVEST